MAADRVGPVQATIGAATFRMSDPIVTDLSKVPIASSTRGLMGAELFERYVVRIDPRAQTLTLYEPQRSDTRGAASASPSCSPIIGCMSTRCST